jgi:hypothetical protein
MKSTRLATFVTAFVAVGVALGVLLPATVAAASLPSLRLTIGRKCVGDYGSAANTTFELVWRDSDGGLIGKKAVTTDEFGYWNFCATGHHTLSAGDRLKVTVGADSKTLTIPDLTLTVNRVHNYLSGRAPAGTGLRVLCTGGNGFEPCIWNVGVRAGVNGYWSHPVPWDVTGYHGFDGQPFELHWRSPAGDSVYVDANAPTIHVEVGTANVWGYYDANATSYVRLYDSSMTLKATAAITGAPYLGAFQGTFRDSGGNLVKSGVGDTVASGIASNARFVLPQIDATATASTDRVTGQCENTSSSLGYADISLYRTGKLRGSASAGDQDGAFDFDFRHADEVYNEANIKRGDRLVIDCAQGDTDGAEITIYAQ